MLLGLEGIDTDIAGIFGLVGVVCFVLAAFGVAFRLNLIALGLAFFATPFVYNWFSGVAPS